MAELPGSFGKYYLSDKIAAGGMAEIYLAKLIGPGGFEKQLVLKQISPELSRERQFVDLLVAEAKTLVSLSHGNIVPVYELGVVDDTYFIAMEYVDGPTLGELLAAVGARNERLEPAVAACIASELCKGLDYAHRKGVVHRDLSPRNVLLSRDGEVKLVDFGLALAGDRARRVQSGVALPAGSFPYMSPEQVRRDPLDARSDLFSLGVLLWEMLTGSRLFARDTADATLDAVLHAPIPAPSGVRSGVPAELDRICLRALARAWDERHASAGEILAALTRFAYSVDPPVTQATLAGLVALVCPPVVRPGGLGGESGAESPAIGEPASASGLDCTRPIEGRSAGRRGSAAMRTLATSEHFDQVLANATPLVPFPALSDHAARSVASPAAPPEPAAGKAGRARAERKRHVGGWAAGAVLAAASLAAFLMIGTGGASPDGSPPDPGSRVGGDAHSSPVRTPAPRPGSSPSPHPSSSPSPHPSSSPSPHPSSSPSSSPSAGHDPTPIAASTTPPSPSASAYAATALPAAGKDRRPKGQGALQVGANPWADVYLDGALLGQAPGAWSVPAGPHAVQLRHHDQRRTYRISIDAGKTESLGLVDFTVR